MHFDEKVPDWAGLPIIDGLLLSYEFPSTLKDTITGIPLKQKQPVKFKSE
jgi:hypothetical protein